ncbi:hypothetical protein GGX14DRAFT_610941 [Mycena pura]|uniref:Oxidoreductase-like domain-containing protein n=1 Tax=Mycena pura TaxID=153505 RepID=A0AAD6YFP0_9AGAR|nr:hypothetical protein GGX14DRAFT_610941 [Mycena pura]
MLQAGSLRSSFASVFRLYSTATAAADDGAVAVVRLKKPNRGGQNLSLRFRGLEQSLRGKAYLQRDIVARESERSVAAAAAAAAPTVADTSVYFRGFEIPQRPRPPAADECCMSGCAVCVYDLYEESRAAYRASIAALRSALASAGVPRAEWPPGALEAEPGGTGESADGASASAARSAFEALERALAEKRARARAAAAP